MELCRETLDDILAEIYPALLTSKTRVRTSRGDTREIVGVAFELSAPRARLSRTETRGKPFSGLGELLWYLSRDNSLDFIRYYIQRYEDESEDGVTVYGGYGPRLFGHRGQNQIENVIQLLRKKPNTRRAVVQIFDAADLRGRRVEIPCTTAIQYLIRDGKLLCIVTMRSNDAYKGLPHDVFCFTMLQEIMARTLGVEIGPYHHFAASLHLYEENCADAQHFLNERIQKRTQMPPMPGGDPWAAIINVLDAEDRIRMQEHVDADKCGVEPYWADIIRLLQIFEASGNEQRINDLKAAMVFKKYNAYIDTRKNAKAREPFCPRQFKLRF